ncbi:MAG: hypothetical protein A2445_02355 [Candidatus Jacksonbacteria bacterium RIFOXYC2_FULL_44_29]|nr:MAG: hypothetical protein UW45_C0047G0005 [Parcubacteria group bacterium GW2011_GWC2_44_22]OGY75499.1 MAG: hypothetical protein A2240_03230 [Candidatus Jacksonbacteria bacterium RIFOXYA2_FULL_43_12]OGY75839.1 MAG: hypothetical protein A2295_00200 [Candidatus Jacksonbacteria bacterium RIFOXYB2_FULL_44_15]OGY79084.1 MAG: hypothetical protein A2445_02355 [Candidatus Jacksonbacteria bacterium RIFOXYC2_FULL_44_29]OGY80264.1 MAG: hypothetical protein A2550_04000 [Candidatus Jacksonbacteria bacteri
MPKLPIINSRQMVGVLKKFGFVELRHKSSSHLMLKHPDGRWTIVPIHGGRDIPKGTLKSILKATDISLEDLIKNL